MTAVDKGKNKLKRYVKLKTIVKLLIIISLIVCIILLAYDNIKKREDLQTTELQKQELNQRIKRFKDSYIISNALRDTYIYSGPSSSTRTIKKIKHSEELFLSGMSQDIDELNGSWGYWFRVVEPKNILETFRAGKLPKEAYNASGWVFGPFFTKTDSIKPTVYISEAHKDYERGRTIKSENGSFNLDLLHLSSDYSQYVFFEENSNAVNSTPGTFFWDTTDNSIRHISYNFVRSMPNDPYEELVTVIHNFELAIFDSGTSGVREVSVYNIITGEEVISGTYWGDLSFDEDSIVVSYLYQPNKEHYGITTEGIIEAQSFLRTFPVDELWIRYRYDFNTNKKTLIDFMSDHSLSGENMMHMHTGGPSFTVKTF